MNRETISNSALGILALCAVTITALVVKRELFTGKAATGPQLTRVANWQQLASSGTILYNAADPPATLIEFTDFQCPACKQLSSSLVKLREAYPQLRVVIRHFPLEAIHPFALEAALAAECANEVGKFPQMEEQLFANQATMNHDQWGKIADLAGVKDTARLVKCVQDSTHVDRIRRDAALGDQLEVNATPTVLVNDQRISNGAPYSLLDSLIKARLK